VAIFKPDLIVVFDADITILAEATAQGSFMIWTHHLKNITYNSSFVPDGAPSTEIYSGVLCLFINFPVHMLKRKLFNLQQLLSKQEYSGTKPTLRKPRSSFGRGCFSRRICQIGWLLGGGHGAISPQYGLGKYIEFVSDLKFSS
jgi:hypothetical protein